MSCTQQCHLVDARYETQSLTIWRGRALNSLQPAWRVHLRMWELCIHQGVYDDYSVAVELSRAMISLSATGGFVSKPVRALGAT